MASSERPSTKIIVSVVSTLICATIIYFASNWWGHVWSWLVSAGSAFGTSSSAVIPFPDGSWLFFRSPRCYLCGELSPCFAHPQGRAGRTIRRTPFSTSCGVGVTSPGTFSARLLSVSAATFNSLQCETQSMGLGVVVRLLTSSATTATERNSNSTNRLNKYKTTSSAKFTASFGTVSGRSLFPIRPMTPNHALQRTAAGHRCCNRRAAWPPSLSLGRSAEKYLP